jgi:hypothetical protein
MKVKLLEAVGTEPLIEAEIDCSKHHDITPEIIRWRDMDFLYHDIVMGDGPGEDCAIYVRPVWTTVVNWYPEAEEPHWHG